jgi:hypothetical protein
LLRIGIATLTVAIAAGCAAPPRETRPSSAAAADKSSTAASKETVRPAPTPTPTPSPPAAQSPPPAPSALPVQSRPPPIYTPATSRAEPVSACQPGIQEIGVLVVTSDAVLINAQLARTGRIVCDGDHITTDATGVGDVIISGDHESDSIHFAGDTDPSLHWTAAHCINVDHYRKGTVIVQSRKLCMIVRTPDVLVYQPPNTRNLFAVKPGAPTEIKAFRGAAPVRLNPLSDAQLRAMTTVKQVLSNQAPAATQPKAGATNFYSNQALAAPPRTLTATELRNIETMRAVPPNVKQITRP